jgi:hypothetical protein
MLGEFLRKLSVALESTGVPYMLTGSLASSLYGVPRSTNDIDFVVFPTREQLLSLLQFLKRLGLFVQDEQALLALRNGTMFNVIDFQNSWKVDFIIRKDREFSVTEFERRKTHEVEGIRLTLATPEDVIIAKLEWAQSSGSERQIDDVAGILRFQGEKLNLPYIEEWVAKLGLGDQWIMTRRKAV